MNKRTEVPAHYKSNIKIKYLKAGKTCLQAVLYNYTVHFEQQCFLKGILELKIIFHQLRTPYRLE